MLTTVDDAQREAAALRGDGDGHDQLSQGHGVIGHQERSRRNGAGSIAGARQSNEKQSGAVSRGSTSQDELCGTIARPMNGTREPLDGPSGAWTPQLNASALPEFDVAGLCPGGSAARRELIACLAQMFREVRSYEARDDEHIQDIEDLVAAPGQPMTVDQDMVVRRNGQLQHVAASTSVDQHPGPGLPARSRL